MRIVLLSETYSKDMGYATTALPKALARLGAEVHLVTLDLPPYYNAPDFQQTYASFVGVSGHPDFEEVDGYKVHYLPHGKTLGYMRMRGLFGKLKEIRPNIVQTLVTIAWIPLDAAIAKPFLGYKLFTGSHTTASIFPLARRDYSTFDPEYIRSVLTRATTGRVVSFFAEKCYGATQDCADVATRFFGVPSSKIAVCPLGVDTDIFFKADDVSSQEQRLSLRREFGASSSDILCIYTGRFSNDKNPLILAKAIERLRATGAPFRGIFVGEGVQKEAIASCLGCVVHPFVPVGNLGGYFRAADIGVWPTQESMSMLDCAACGLPIVVNDTMVAVERIDGNGITYKLNDIEDMVRALQSLRDPSVRSRLGDHGARKITVEFSWESIARRRLKDYESALSRGNGKGRLQ